MGLKLKSESVKETKSLGQFFASKLVGNEVVMLYGDLGAGKTTFVKGMAQALGIDAEQDVSSPTYNIMNCYMGRKFPVYHFDMYRIHTEEDLYSVGFFDYIGTGLTLIEWSENIENFFPGPNSKDKIIKVNISYSKENKDFRNFEFNGCTYSFRL